MARQCQICINKSRRLIDEALLNGASNRSIAKHYDVDHNAVQRHRKHIPEALSQSHEARKIADSDELLEQQDNLLRLSWSITNGLIATGNPEAALKGIKEIRENLKVLLEVAGKINQNQQINVIMNPQFLQIQSILMDELKPFPELRDRIAGRLSEVKS